MWRNRKRCEGMGREEREYEERRENEKGKERVEDETDGRKE